LSSESLTTAVWEAWAVTTTSAPAPIARLDFLATGRPEITSPNFISCGGCIVVVPDGLTQPDVNTPLGAYADLIDEVGPTNEVDAWVLLDVAGDPSLPGGRKHALTVPARFRNFGTTGSCLFGTVPSDNSILRFTCNDVTQLPHFSGAGAGDLLVFTSLGSVWLIDGLEGNVFERIHTSTGIYEDLSFSPVKKAVIQVGRTSQDDDNPGGRTGKIKFYIMTGTGFTDPLGVIDESSLRFGATGTEDSDVSCKNVGTDVNGDGFPDPMCEADAEIANCDAPLFCILTGVTENPSAFEGGD